MFPPHDDKLGALKSVHKQKKTPTVVAVVWLIFLVPVAIACFGIGFAQLFRGQVGDVWMGLLFAGITGSVCVYQGWVLTTHTGQQVAVYDNGIVVKRRFEQLVWPYDEITDYFRNVVRRYVNGVYVGTFHTYRVYRGKQKLVFDQFEDIQGLGETIGSQVSARLIGDMVQRYNRGDEVTFGRIALSKQGIRVGRKQLPWAEVESAKWNRGWLSIRKKGKWLGWSSVSAASVSNLPAFMHIMKQLGHG